MSYKTKPCAVCQRVQRMSGETCSRECRTALVRQRYGNGWYQKVSIAGSKKAAAKSAERRQRRWAVEYPEVPPAVASALYDAGYRSGYTACHQATTRRLDKVRAKSFDEGRWQAQLDRIRKSA